MAPTVMEFLPGDAEMMPLPQESYDDATITPKFQDFDYNSTKDQHVPGLRERKKDPVDVVKYYNQNEEETPLKLKERSLPNYLASFITDGEVKWLNVIVLLIIHISGLAGLVYALVEFSYSHLAIGITFGVLGGLGVTAGAHRYYTHRSYQAKLPLQIILLTCYTIAGQNTIYDWVRDHRLHHKFSETEADPHNAKRGFFFSHVGWLMVRKTDAVKKKGSKIDMTDITSDPLVALHTRYLFLLQAFLCFGLPTGLAVAAGNSLTSAIFINMLRYMLSLNFTWSVNSFAHIYGNRPYDKRMAAVENWFVSLVAVGEGWHNYHHAFPWDYRASELGVGNITKGLIDTFASIGWAYGLKTASDNLIDSVSANHGDGTRVKKSAVHLASNTKDLYNCKVI